MLFFQSEVVGSFELCLLWVTNVGIGHNIAHRAKSSLTTEPNPKILWKIMNYSSCSVLVFDKFPRVRSADGSHFGCMSLRFITL